MVAASAHRRDQPRGAGRADGRPQGAAAGREGAGPAARAGAGGEGSASSPTIRACRGSRASASRCGPARSSASPGSPATVSRELLEALAGIRTPLRGQIRCAACRSPTRCRPGVRRLRPRARGSAARWAWSRASRPTRTPSSATRSSRDTPTTASCKRRQIVDPCRTLDAAATTSARRTRLLDATLLLRRQPAEAGPRPRDGARPRPAPRRPADPRRRHRRHRVHPRRLIAMRDAGKAVRLVSVELDESCRFRPHHRHVRRHRHRRALCRRGGRAADRAAHRRDHQGGGVRNVGPRLDFLRDPVELVTLGELRSSRTCRRSRQPALPPKWRARRNGVSAVIALPVVIAKSRLCGTWSAPVCGSTASAAS